MTTFMVRQLWLVTGVIVASSAQVVTYLGRPQYTAPRAVTPESSRQAATHISTVSTLLHGVPSYQAVPSARATQYHRQADIVTRGWSPRKIPTRPVTALPLIDELSVILAESKHLADTQDPPPPGGTGLGTAATGAATYHSAAFYNAGKLGEHHLAKGYSAGDPEIRNAEQSHTYGETSGPSQQRSLLDRVLDPSANVSEDDDWRAIGSTRGSKSAVRSIETELSSNGNNYQAIPIHRTYNAYLESNSPIGVSFITTAAPNSGVKLPATPGVELTTIQAHFSSQLTRLPSETYEPSQPGKLSLVSQQPDRKQDRHQTTAATSAPPATVLTSRGPPVARFDGAPVAGGGASEATNDNVPGRPGRDYPTYSQPPVTDFSCSDKVHGLYADFETRCQVWHFCHENGHHRFLCLTGTVFSPVSRTCDWWYNVDCHYDAFPPF